MKSIFTFLFIIFSLSISYAQLQKGAYQIGGEASLIQHGFLSNSPEPAFYSELFSGSSGQWGRDVLSSTDLWKANTIPSFQYFLSDRLSIGATAGFETTFAIDSNATNKQKITRNLFLFSPEATYFFNPKAKWKMYATASYLLAYSQNKNSNKPTANYKNLTNGFALNIGVNRFLNENIALNTSLYFDYNDVRKNGKKDYIFRHSGLSISLQNFIAQPLNQQFEENLLGKKRRTIGASLTLDLDYKNMLLLMDYGYFPLKNLLVGINSSSNLYFGALRNINHRSDIKPYIQYYIPITKKTAILANVSTPISIISYHKKKTVIVPAIGINHFLSKYVAVEALVKYTPERESHIYEDGQGFSFETNIRYFLK